jgi:hypothetical protein
LGAHFLGLRIHVRREKVTTDSNRSGMWILRGWCESRADAEAQKRKMTKRSFAGGFSEVWRSQEMT